ncbi:NHL repeat-containing protein 2 [Cimex lectularius]|uniref:Thioredoxin domain-containing protein n=1 Tax=Cimex lectularius TaxID=79782 RepID=A0A8I6S0Z5_CIMLE|nr:NHL repeat-containing protein 2 [Cimex lectularius]
MFRNQDLSRPNLIEDRAGPVWRFLRSVRRILLTLLWKWNYSSLFSNTVAMSDVIEGLQAESSDLARRLKGLTDDQAKEDALVKYFDQLDVFGVTLVQFDFPLDLDWINTTRPLSLRGELNGKVVLLDFFTYCCINCMHVLPSLRLLEQEFPISEGFIVVGVHSGKFTNEKDVHNIEHAVRRYGLLHPVVNDQDNQFWNMLGCTCWPTLCLISPFGSPFLILMGEGHYETLRSVIKFALKFYKGNLNVDPLSEIIVPRKNVGGCLSFPGKVTVSPDGSYIAIADTHNHRILIVGSKNSQILDIIGTKESGFADGSYKDAKFFDPQGLCCGPDNVLYVADTENHAIRVIDQNKRTVATLVGNGQQGTNYIGGLDGTVQEISSPWDVLLHNDILFIAMAGTHQIWGYALQDVYLWGRNLSKGKCYALVGSGKEENKNNTRPLLAALAQPSGLTVSNEGVLYFADSESSAVRRVRLNYGNVEGVVGGHLNPSNLFAFGDVDGVGNAAKLQHPLDVAYCSNDDKVYVVDSYNHKLKVINTKTKTITTVTPSNSVQFNEPGGIACHQNLIYIADTNNHCIRIFNTDTKYVSTMDIKEIKGKQSISGGLFKDHLYDSHIVVNQKGSLEIKVELTLPEGVGLTRNAPSNWSLLLNDEKLFVQDEEFSLTKSWIVKVNKMVNSNALIKCRIFLCSDSRCSVKELKFRIGLKFDDSAPMLVNYNISHTVE